MEVWRNTPYSEKHEVSDLGYVRNKKTGKTLKGSRKGGYLYVGGVAFHRMVCGAFHGHGGGLHVNHKDGNKLNNRPENLEWVTPEENLRHAMDNDLLKPAKIACIDKDGIITPFRRLRDASESLGVSVKMIEKSLYKERKSTNGYIFFHQGADIPDNSILKVERVSPSKGVRFVDNDGKVFEYGSIGEASRVTGKQKKSISHWCRGDDSIFGEWSFI